MALSPFYLGFGINPFLKEKRHFFYTNELPRRRAAGYPKNIERPKGRGIKP